MKPVQQIIHEGNAIIQAQSNVIARKESIIIDLTTENISQKSNILKLNKTIQNMFSIQNMDEKRLKARDDRNHELNVLLDDRNHEIQKWQAISLLCIIFAAIMGGLVISNY